MAVYTVHQPPLRNGETAPDPDRFVFVRDGFYFWAFVFGPLWLAWRRLWLALVLYVAALIAIEAALRYAGAGTWPHSLAILGVALLVGLEAGTLRRWTLERRGWKNVGVVVGDDIEEAERRFFAGRTAQADAEAKSAEPQARSLPRAAPASEVIGLFPHPDRPR
jgi:hypothetical protein